VPHASLAITLKSIKATTNKIIEAAVGEGHEE
jgi:hypothetical protein